ncbi:hypothetical protein RUND412_011400, partial [Rhizina undulata]
MSLLSEAREIIAALHELPLALDQAAACICSKQIPFSSHRKILNEHVMPPGSILLSCKSSILSTWELLFEDLCEDARQLLQLCAFLDNEDIPEELFRRGKEFLDWILEDEDRLETAIEDLYAFSFAKRRHSIDSFWIHPLVHTWARERNDSTVQQKNAETAIALVASSIATDGINKTSADWLFKQHILSHLKVCEAHISEYFSCSDSTPSTAEASFTFASAYNELVTLAREEKAFGIDGPSSSTLGPLDNLAMVCLETLPNSPVGPVQTLWIGPHSPMGGNGLDWIKNMGPGLWTHWSELGQS